MAHVRHPRLIENGVDLRTIEELGGWSQIKMLERYEHVSPSRKTEAVEGLGGKFPYAIHSAGETTTRTAAVTG